MKKAEKLSHMFQKIKRQKIKETQDTWRSQFEETQQERAQRMNIDDKYRDVAKQRKLMNEMQDQDEDEQAKLRRQKEYDEQIRAQEFIEVEGEKIFVKGLDLNLLKKQRAIQQKKKVVPDYASKINEKMRLAENVNKIGSNKLYRQMIQRIKKPRATKTAPSINQNTYYEFDINWEFGAIAPKVITKLPPKHHKNPSFPNITTQAIRQLVNIIAKKPQKQQMVEKQMDAQEQQDNIFDEAPEDNIHVGAKLQFGVEDVDKLYQNVTKRQLPQQSQQDKFAFEFQQSQKRRKLMQQDEGDYYGQCYWEIGPSLEQLKNLRKEGISYYQFQDPSRERGKKDKQKTVDYTKQFHKIKRIIAEKEGKPK